MLLRLFWDKWIKWHFNKQTCKIVRLLKNIINSKAKWRYNNCLIITFRDTFYFLIKINVLEIIIELKKLLEIWQKVIFQFICPCIPDRLEAGRWQSVFIFLFFPVNQRKLTFPQTHTLRSLTSSSYSCCPESSWSG